jgi:homoserine O-acetyltransferase
MGGMRVLEWAVSAPDRMRKIAAIATTARTSADNIAWSHLQQSAIMNDPNFHNGHYYSAGQGPTAGLGLARQIAHATYRSSEEFDARFGQTPQGDELPQGGGRYAVQSYLEHHASKLARRFDANSYMSLTRAMMSHDLGRDRRGLNSALNRVQADALVLAIDTDRLFPPVESQILAHGMPHTQAFSTIHSNHGHDGFLIETSAVGQLVADFLH